MYSLKATVLYALMTPYNPSKIKSHKFTNLSFYDITVTLKGFQLMEPEHFSSCSFWTYANISHNFTNLIFVTSSILFSKAEMK